MQKQQQLLKGHAGVDASLARHGHISYLEIPAADVEQSARFYESVFGWELRRRDGGQCSFDDRSGNLIGRWKTGRAPSSEPGLLPFIYVDQIDAIAERIVQAGGQIVEPPRPEGNLWVATFRDPAGNLLGIWQAGARQDVATPNR
jgi:hypothetical protein